jgi:hypothetical protein
LESSELIVMDGPPEAEKVFRISEPARVWMLTIES